MLGRYKKQFLDYLNKENLDHNLGFIDAYEFHSCYITLAKLFGVMDYEKLAYWMYISPVCVVISGSVGTIISILSLITFIKKFQIHLITECATYCLVLCYKLLIISCAFFDKKYYHSLLRSLRDDFEYICTKGLKYRDRFFENQKLTFKVCVLSSIFTGSIGSGMAIWGCISLAMFIAVNGLDHVEQRPLPFPFLIFGYEESSPGFEILFVMCILFTFFHTYTYIFMVQSQILWVRQIMCKADVIIWSIQDLLKDVFPTRSKSKGEFYAQLIRSRMREIILMHHSMFKLLEDYAAVFKKCLLYEQKLGSPIICMTAYGFAEKLDEGEFQGILLMLCVAVIVLVFIPSYLCTLLLEKIQSVSDACWDTPFWNARPVLRPYLVLIMQRSMRQLPIVAAGFEDISLQTYSNVLTRAYSCFNMLRQSGT